MKLEKQIIHTANAAVTGAPLRQAIRFGQMLYCSGASPRDPKQGNKVVDGGFTEQATQSLENLKAILEAALPEDLQRAILAAYERLSGASSEPIDVAVRSSATAEDLPDASFAGQQETYLNVRGGQALLESCKRCFASLYTDRAISYRVDRKFDHLKVGLSIGVQRMVRSDLAASGVMFSIDTETGFRDAVLINAGRGRLQKDADILRALEDGTLKEASLDVFEVEPLPKTSRLWGHPKIFITPHSAATSDPVHLAPIMLKQMDAFERGEPLENLVDLKAGY